MLPHFSKPRMTYDVRRTRHQLGLILVLLAAVSCGGSTPPHKSEVSGSEPPTREASDPGPYQDEAKVPPGGSWSREPSAHPAGPHPRGIEEIVLTSNLTEAQRACLSSRRDVESMCREVASTAVLQGTWCGTRGTGFTIEGDRIIKWGGRSGWHGRISVRRDEMPGWLETVVLDSGGSRETFGPVGDPCALPRSEDHEVLVYGRGHPPSLFYYRVAGRDCSCLFQARDTEPENP